MFSRASYVNLLLIGAVYVTVLSATHYLTSYVNYRFCTRNIVVHVFMYNSLVCKCMNLILDNIAGQCVNTIAAIVATCVVFHGKVVTNMPLTFRGQPEKTGSNNTDVSGMTK